MDNPEHKIPRNVLGLYIKLYCKKRRLKTKTGNILIEARRSWTSLSKTEKLKFIKKYEECRSLFKNKFANHLKKSKPYLKKKPELLKTTQKLSDDDVEISNKFLESNLNNDNNLPQTPVAGDNDLMSNDNNETDGNMCNGSKLHESLVINEYINPEPTPLLTDDIHSVVVPEPSPPIMLSGKELYEMLKKEDKTWFELPQSQRRQYQSAVLTIKKNYLKQYQQYLESLPSLQLIEHYKTLRTDLI